MNLNESLAVKLESSLPYWTGYTGFYKLYHDTRLKKPLSPGHLPSLDESKSKSYSQTGDWIALLDRRYSLGHEQKRTAIGRDFNMIFLHLLVKAYNVTTATAASAAAS